MDEISRMVDAPIFAEDGGGASASDSSMTLEQALVLLSEKERDLELAANIGQALLKENEKMRGAVEEAKALRMELENSEETLGLSKQNERTLQNRIGILTDSLGELDIVNAQLTAKIQTLEFEFESREPVTVRSAPKLVSFDSSSAMDELEATLLSWKTRAMEAEQLAKTNSLKFSETEKSLDKHIEELKIQLRLMAMKETETVSQVRRHSESVENELQNEIQNLEKEIKALQQENQILSSDLEEHKLVRQHRRHVSEAPVDDVDIGDSLASELESAIGSEETVDVTKTLKPGFRFEKSLSWDPLSSDSDVAKETRASQDVDPYFFHFHMTCNAVRAQISLSSSMKNTSGTQAFSKSALDAINSMDTQLMYDEVLQKAIPPHQWDSFIRDTFRAALLKTLQKGNNVNNELPVSSPQSAIKRGGAFGRFLASMYSK